ncbi:MAG: hypothetical protein JNK61_08955 [Bacteroidia bacterium]|nr:hypothetical protein [Bacteroidia bacterium]HQU99924.1 hypothetical protein [Bacteroidia bacterium]
MWVKQHQLLGHSGAIYAIGKGYLDNTILTGGADQVLVQWHTETAAAGKVIAKAAGTIYCIKVIDALPYILMGTATGDLHIINYAQNKEVKLLRYHQNGVYDVVAYQPLQLMLIAGGDGLLSVCNIEGQLIKQVKIAPHKLRYIAIHPAQDVAYIGCGNGHLVSFDLQHLQVIADLPIHRTNWSCNTIAFINDNQIITGGRDAMLHITDVQSMQIQKSIAAHNYAIYDMVFNADKSLMATASRDKSIKIWDTQTWHVLHKLSLDKTEGHKNSVNKIYWHTGLNKIISVSDDKSIIIWQQQL